MRNYQRGLLWVLAALGTVGLVVLSLILLIGMWEAKVYTNTGDPQGSTFMLPKVATVHDDSFFKIRATGARVVTHPDEPFCDGSTEDIVDIVSTYRVTEDFCWEIDDG